MQSNQNQNLNELLKSI